MEKVRQSRTVVVLVMACTALAVLVVLLAVQNHSLKTRAGASPPLPADALEAGQELGPMALVTAPGQTTELAFGHGERHTLLMVFSKGCPACRKTMPLWNDWVRELEGRPGVRVLGVHDEREDGTEPSTVPAFQVYPFDAAASTAMEHIPYIPATIVIDASGLVEYVKFGIPAEKDLAELRRTIDS